MTGRNGIEPRVEARLVLADGTSFEGEAVGAVPDGGITTGEAVFNTVLSGYQEVITDPSYAGQVIAFTYPHIGNYGVNPTDDEASRPHCRGLVVRDLADRPSSWRSTGSLEEFLVRFGVPGITGVDTRRLTRHLRDRGAMPCAFGTVSASELLAAAEAAPSTEGRDLVTTVTTATIQTRGSGPYRVVAYDFGIKEAMLRQLGDLATVIVVPASTPAAPWWRTDRSRCSGSASATSCWPPHSGPPPSNCPSGTTAGTTRSAASRPGGWRSPRRTTTTRWPRTPSPPRRSPT